MWQLLFLLLPLAAASGWYFGYKQSRTSPAQDVDNTNLPNNYFLGLNYLINEQPDKAVDAFIKVLAVDSNTVEMHLALGNLFRRRGEVDRAIKIHQNLIARPKLTREQRNNAISELAQDYLRAGVLDRAEKLFLELIDAGGDNAANYCFLLSLYETQKDWRQAIATAQKLANLSFEASSWTPIAYYYSELAEEALQQGLTEQAEIYLKKALSHDKNCVRANIILGELAEAALDYKMALRFYEKVKDQDLEFLSEVAPLLSNCYEKLGYKADELIVFLQNALQEMYSVSLALFLVKYIDKHHGAEASIKFIGAQNKHGTSLRILDYLIDLSLRNTALESTKPNLQLAKQLLGKLLDNKPYYRCTNCGLGTKQLYWQCPGCRRWAALKPIRSFAIER